MLLDLILSIYLGVNFLVLWLSVDQSAVFASAVDCLQLPTQYSLLIQLVIIITRKYVVCVK